MCFPVQNQKNDVQYGQSTDLEHMKPPLAGCFFSPML